MLTGNLLSEVGSLVGAVDAALAFSSALWLTHANESAWLKSPFRQPDRVMISREFTSTNLQAVLLDSPLARTPGINIDRLANYLLDTAFGTSDPASSELNDFGIEQNWFSALDILIRYKQVPLRQAELQYALMRRIRERTQVVLSASVARAAYKLGDEVARISGEDGSCRVERECHLKESLNAVLDAHNENYVQLAMEVWSAIGAIRPNTTKPSYVEFNRELLDGGRLVSTVFGLPTSVIGFDDLFNGGLILPDRTNSRLLKDVTSECVGARTTVVTAPFGSGKSLLSLQIAVEVARKGGVAWVLEIEQTAQEFLYALESIGVSSNDPSFSVVTGYAEAFPVLSRPSPGRGALVFLPAHVNSQSNNDQSTLTSFQELVQNLPKKLHWLDEFPLRLLIIDPLTALYPAGSADDRAKAVQLIREAKREGVNIWITSEQSGEDSPKNSFEENIADTVIRLGVAYETSERYIQVTKSRLQREKAGRHVFRISDTGLTIHPTPAGYLRYAPPSSSSRRSFRELTEWGVSGLREILGRNAIHEGDVVTLHGVTGTSKTIMGLQFLLASERPRDPNARSLFIGDVAESRMRFLVSQTLEQATTEERRRAGDVLTLSLRSGLTDPGDLLTQIRQKLETEEFQNRKIDRILLTNLSRWQFDMPRVGEDQSFPLALIALLRQYAAVSMLICGHSSEQPESRLEKMLLEMSDCTLELKRAEFRGQDRYYLRVLKSRQMQHRRGRFEVTVKESGVAVSLKESLIRLNASGTAEAVEVVLFLHSETRKHDLYNERLVGSLRAALSPRTSLAPQTLSYDPQVLRLSSVSGLDEVQILQLDQFQIPFRTKKRPIKLGLHSFPWDVAGPLLEGRIGRLNEFGVYMDNGARFVFAVPFYCNVSLIAWQKNKLIMLPQDWSVVADQCAAYTGNDLFFACHVSQSNQFESYNCLFLEILYSKLKLPQTENCDLEAWLLLDRKITEEVLRCFCVLVRPWHNRMSELLLTATSDKNWQEGQNKLTSQALVTRHWYNTLNQMMGSLKPADRSGYAVEWLPSADPHQPRMTTAGEWYLAVPQHSAAPEVALEVIDFLTSPDKEMQRVHIGIGLPTRSDYYRSQTSDVSQYFTLDTEHLETLILNAFRRSQFSCYQAFAETMSSHLQRLLEMDNPNYSVVLDSLIASLRFVQTRQTDRQ